ncbi:hypothetical protein ACFE04_019502 [Oxalis oulophora]
MDPMTNGYGKTKNGSSNVKSIICLQNSDSSCGNYVQVRFGNEDSNGGILTRSLEKKNWFAELVLHAKYKATTNVIELAKKLKLNHYVIKGDNNKLANLYTSRRQLIVS